jgi:hypothetical protein
MSCGALFFFARQRTIPQGTEYSAWQCLLCGAYYVVMQCLLCSALGDASYVVVRITLVHAELLRVQKHLPFIDSVLLKKHKPDGITEGK